MKFCQVIIILHLVNWAFCFGHDRFRSMQLDKNTWPQYIYSTVGFPVGSKLECSTICTLQANMQCLSFVHLYQDCHLGTSQPFHSFLGAQTLDAKLFLRAGEALQISPSF